MHWRYRFIHIIELSSALIDFLILSTFAIEIDSRMCLAELARHSEMQNHLFLFRVESVHRRSDVQIVSQNSVQSDVCFEHKNTPVNRVDFPLGITIPSFCERFCE